MLELTEITKVYRGGRRAIDGVTLHLGPGVLGLLGPNGAGKSTLMRIAATATRPTHGRVVFADTVVSGRPRALRRALGYLPQDFGFHPNLTGREFLSYLAAAKGVPAHTARRRIGELLKLVALDSAADRRLGTYSGGMLRRVGIAQALVNDPRVIILDEPTVGLDPDERSRFHSLLSELAAERVVILSTHIVPDVEAVATDVAIIANGRILDRGHPAALTTQLDGRVWEAHVDPVALAHLRQAHTVVHAVRDGDLVRVRILSDAPPLSDAVAVPPELEDAYRAAAGAQDTDSVDMGARR